MSMALMSGYPETSEWLILIAAVALVIDGIIRLVARPDPTRGALVPFGLALLAVAWLIL